MTAVIDNWRLVLEGFGYTLCLFLVAGVLSLLLGTFLVACRVGPVAVLRWFGAVYVTGVRNTPLVVVFAFFQFIAPIFGIRFRWFDVQIGTLDFDQFFGAAVVSLTLYTACFVCEAIRSGINAVPLGQAEASRAIGLTFVGTMRHVILPQAFRASVPPLASALIALIKNTSVAYIFGVAEAVSQMSSLTNDNASQRPQIFLTIAAGYILIVFAFSFLANRLERHWRVA
ncbi:amino acid ABC transporter permease [Nocardioides sp.]|uniref:amino acid ABC transporter permease n=1 Tax=Nocardioides sp. TaxID=35761 RepID=UPI002BB8119D|nr:amino acid ABC transporter permease [Nocardioides sp.]HSX68020.1 amino acid ABC transporter permease [Nocardioides sp.]